MVALAAAPRLAGLRGTFRQIYERTVGIDAVSLIATLVVLLIGIPSVLIFRPLGAAGTPANMLGMLMLLWWIAARLVPRLGVAASWQPVRFAIAIFAVAALLSYAGAMLHGWGLPVGLQEKTAYGSGSLQLYTVAQVSAKEVTSADRGLLSVAAWSGIALVTADGIGSRQRMSLVLKVLVTMGTFMAVLGMLQYFFGLDIASYFKVPGLSPNGDFGSIAVRTVRRVSATAVHPIEFGVVLAGILPIAVHRAMYAEPGKRTLPWICAALIGTALPMSVSRSAILALGVGGILMLGGWSARRRVSALIVASLFAVMLKLLIHGLLGTVRSLFMNLGNDPSVEGRTEDYAVAGRLFHQHPWLGRGLFTFIPSLYRTFDNAYLLALVEIGLVGAAILVLLFSIGIFTARGARRRAPDAEGRDLGQALAASVAALGASAATFDMLEFPMAAGLTFLLLGCTGAAWRLHREETRAVESADVETGSEKGAVTTQAAR